MKSLVSLFLPLLALLSAPGHAQTVTAFPAKAKGPATETVQFKTSAVCDMCKARLEKSLAYEKGVQSATLDVPSKVLTVTFRPDKTSAPALRTAVQKTGYDADELPADARAYSRLPECCRNPDRRFN